MEDIRRKFIEARNIVNDVQHGYPGWFQGSNIEGLINCGMTTMYDYQQEMIASEIRNDDQTALRHSGTVRTERRWSNLTTSGD